MTHPYKTVIWQQFDIADAPTRLEIMARNDEKINELSEDTALGLIDYYATWFDSGLACNSSW